jgi:DNA-binding NtrC family response regulator/tetratricopeptide (TPR) repeat protein
MSTLRVPTLDVSWFRSREERVRSRLRTLSLHTSGSELAALIHDAVSVGLASHVLHECRALEPSGLTPDHHFALACAEWEAGDRDAVIRRARAALASHDELAIEHERVIVRAAWAGVLVGEEDPVLVSALDRVRVRVTDEQVPPALVADLAHLDAYRDLVQSAKVERAQERAALAAELYRLLEEPIHECKARVLLARIDAICGRLHSSVENARRAAERAMGAGHPHLGVLALNALGTALFRRGDWAEADVVYERARELAEAFGEVRWSLAVRANRARLTAHRGRLDQARSELEAISSAVHERHARSVVAVIEEYLGQVSLLQGDAHAALEHFDASERELDRCGVTSYERAEISLRRAEALLVLGEPTRAHDLCLGALEHLESTGQTLDLGQILRVRGRAALAMGRPREARECLDRAESLLRTIGDRFELARCLLDRAELVDEAPEIRVAASIEATHLAARVGAVSLADAARELGSVLGATRSSTTPDVPKLTGTGMVAASPSMQHLLAEASTAATSDAPVLIQGETGTGKEVIARFVHDHSRRAERPFIAVNCAAIPESLFEREFFGHVRGAYTGADRDTLGLVQAADGGTLFLDEIGEMPQSLQPKLLRLLQEGTFRRVGDTVQRLVDLRIVAATNRSLFELAQSGEFREDLYWRLSWFELALRPLRERREDVTELAKLFLARASARAGVDFWLTREAWQIVRRHPWPGNARQLESAIASACARAASSGRSDGCVRREDLPQAVRTDRVAQRTRAGENLDLQSSLNRHERELILDALQRADYERAGAARLLGIGRNTLYEKMRKLGIRPEQSARSA